MKFPSFVAVRLKRREENDKKEGNVKRRKRVEKL
jgi:hypothetical protein